MKLWRIPRASKEIFVRDRGFLAQLSSVGGGGGGASSLGGEAPRSLQMEDSACHLCVQGAASTQGFLGL